MTNPGQDPSTLKRFTLIPVDVLFFDHTCAHIKLSEFFLLSNYDLSSGITDNRIPWSPYTTTLEELFHPRYTALVVIDVQNDFCVEGGVCPKHRKYLPKGDAIIKKLKLLIYEARKVGAQIVYIQNQNTSLPNHRSNSAAYLRAPHYWCDKSARKFQPDSNTYNLASYTKPYHHLPDTHALHLTSPKNLFGRSSERLSHLFLREMV